MRRETLNHSPKMKQRLDVLEAAARVVYASMPPTPQQRWPLLDSREVRPVVDTTLPLEQAGDAHRRLEASEHIGKVLLTV